MATPKKATCVNLEHEAHVRKQRAAYMKEWGRALRRQVNEYLGGKCLHCGFNDPRALQVDHINGGGMAERRSMNMAQTVLYRKILSGAPGYQLLCANCNWIKRVEQSEAPGRPRY